MKELFKKASIFVLMLALFYVSAYTNPVLAQTPQALYDRVWKLVNAKFVDQTNNEQDWAQWRHKYDSVIKDEQDAYVAIETMLSSLNDVYTKFLNPKDFKEESESIQGSLQGIGVQIGVREGKLLVIAPIEDTPGERAGLKAQDEILEINGKSTKGITVEAAADQIRGPEGTQVTLLVKRGKEPVKTYNITREKIEIKSVSTKAPEFATIPENLGYIRLSSFISKNATAEFEQALIENCNKDGLIIDLRSNPGGLLTNAIYIADMLLDSQVIVSTVDRDGYKDTTRATQRILTDQPIVVIINGGSASASEILSGALKDNSRATIVGKKSFGKGLVQEINRLPGGSAMHITIQKYLTPNGTDINKKGIIPDYEIDLTEEDIKKERDPQVAKAIEILQSKIVTAKAQGEQKVNVIIK